MIGNVCLCYPLFPDVTSLDSNFLVTKRAGYGTDGKFPILLRDLPNRSGNGRNRLHKRGSLQRTFNDARKMFEGKKVLNLILSFSKTLHRILLFSRTGAALKLAPYLAWKCINSVGLSTIKSKAFLLVTQINNSGKSNTKKSVSRRKCGMYYQPWTILF